MGSFVQALSRMSWWAPSPRLRLGLPTALALVWNSREKQRKRETGSIEPLKQTKFRGRVLEGQDDRLAAAITAQPDATLRELREVLKTSAGIATIWRAVNQLDLTVKKNRSRRRTTTD